MHNEGDDISYGFNLGVLWHTDSTRMGLAYRSEIDHDLEGTADYRHPGNDRVWAAAGASYELTEDWTVDVGYAHLFVDDPKIRRESATGHTPIGEFDASADIVSLQMSLAL